MVPSSGSYSRSSSAVRVVLPAPDGPTSATNSPGETSRLTPSSAGPTGLSPSVDGSGAAGASDARAAASVGGYVNRTSRNSTRPTGRRRGRAPGRSGTAFGVSSTSKTRSNDTIAVMMSTRALVRLVRGM